MQEHSMPAKQHGYFLVQDQQSWRFRMAPSADSSLVEEELKLQLDIKVGKGSEPTLGQINVQISPLSLCLQVCSSVSHEQD
jgi:hypothetical protein